AAEPDGSVIVGKAYLGTVCHARLGAGYTTTEGSAFADTLIAAHEFGHNFGAPHDAEEGSPCQSVPDTFLMAPFVNSSEQFSTCSLEQMAPVIAAATCLEDLFPSDLVLTKLFVGDDVLLGAPFTGTFAVDNTEPEDAFGVAVTFEADPGLELLAVRGTQTTQTGAECTATATGVICQSTGFDPERA
ncbi:MAG TPA: M12 family metallo-peptidase, partial [Gammaproteobacteria bacterium]|nr:M12 family metallo-peptidase [Gammaproteobacteria bacterium]